EPKDGIEPSTYALPRRSPRRRLLLNSLGCSFARFGQRLGTRWNPVEHGGCVEKKPYRIAGVVVDTDEARPPGGTRWSPEQPRERILAWSAAVFPPGWRA